MSRKNEAITITCNSAQKFSLKLIAKDLGYVWGDEGNISQMIQAIANGEIEVSRPTKASKLRGQIKRLEAELFQAEEYPED